MCVCVCKSECYGGCGVGGALGGATKLINHRNADEDQGEVPSSGQMGQHSPSGMTG